MEHVSERLILDRTPPGGSYLYMSPEVIWKAYQTSVLSRKTRDAEASRNAYLTDELSVRLHHKAEYFQSHRPWPERFLSSLEMS